MQKSITPERIHPIRCSPFSILSLLSKRPQRSKSYLYSLSLVQLEVENEISSHSFSLCGIKTVTMSSSTSDTHPS